MKENQTFGRKFKLTQHPLVFLFLLISISALLISFNSEPIKIFLSKDATGINIPEIITTSNTDLPSNMVNVIFIDSNNVKWFGTDAGLARFNDTNWMIYSTNDQLLNNKVNDIDYEWITTGKQLWIATDGGLTASSFDAGGITASTTYLKENSGLANNIVKRVAVDLLHNCWAGTPDALNVRSKNGVWASMTTTSSFDTASHANPYSGDFHFSDTAITDIESYNSDNLVLVSTGGGGILRVKYNEIDGITGASPYSLPWATISSNNVQSLDINGVNQLIGTDNGVVLHASNLTKSNYSTYTIDSGLIDNQVTAVYIDNSDNIWCGTNQGLSVFNGETWYKYNSGMGLVNNSIRYITSDMNGDIWVATAGGVQWFSSIPGVAVLEAPKLISPLNASTVSTDTILMWRSVEGATGYTLQIDTSKLFPNPLYFLENLTSTSYEIWTLKPHTKYYWRVAATKPGDIGPWSQIKRFTTGIQSGINEISQGKFRIETFPNPAFDKIYLRMNLNCSQKITVIIYDLKGSIIDIPFSNTVTELQKTIQIDLADNPNYSSGIYFIHVKGESFSDIRKISKR